MKKLNLFIIFVIFISYNCFSQNKIYQNISKIAYIENKDNNFEFIKIKENENFTAKDFFEKNSKIYKSINKIDYELKTYKTDNIGFTHYIYNQTYNNIKIEDAVYILHEKNGKIVSANGVICYDFNKNEKNKIITENEALNIILNSINAQKYAWEDNNDENITFNYPKGELIYTRINDTLPFVSKNFILAYKFDIFSLIPYDRNYIYVNAYTGRVIKKRTRIYFDCDCCNGTAQTLYNGQQTIVTHHRWLANDYILKDNCRGDGIQTYLNGSNVDDGDNQWSLFEERPATSAHWALEMTYDFYNNVFGRNSFDNSGAFILGKAYNNDNVDNAQWTGSFFYFGSGGSNSSNALVSLDVVGHEFTHAVTENEANLTYLNESGALNESFSDIFGTMVEFYVEGNNGDFLIGEDFWIADGKMRDMSNPNSKNHPDTYHGNYWHYSSSDYGGVHTNSTVQNYWFYLLANGGSGVNDNGLSYNIQGIGRDKAAKIAYRNLTVYLTSSSNYSSAKIGSINSAIDLYGDCSFEVLQTIKAWEAVGVISGNYHYDIVTDCNYLANVSQPTTIKAVHNITSSCDLSSNNQPITYVAGNSIHLLHGFRSGSNFHAYIEDPCFPNAKSSCSENTNYISRYTFQLDTIEMSNNFMVINNNKVNLFSVFPNPNNGNFEIKINKNISGDIHIHDCNGKLIYKQKMNTNNLNINISNKPNGVYILNLILEDEKTIYSEKIILK